MGPGSTRHTCTVDQIIQLYPSPYMGQTTLLQQLWGTHANSLVSIVPCGVAFPFHLYCTIYLPQAPYTQKHPKLSYTLISLSPSLVSAHIYICSLTFSLRPDEAASVWRQRKLVFKISIYCFVSAPRRYRVIKELLEIEIRVSDTVVHSANRKTGRLTRSTAEKDVDITYPRDHLSGEKAKILFLPSNGKTTLHITVWSSPCTISVPEKEI